MASSMAPAVFGPTPCTNTVYMNADGTFDEQDHAVQVVHSWFVANALIALDTISILHAADPEDFVPMCRTCNTSAPCETATAVARARGTNPGDTK